METMEWFCGSTANAIILSTMSIIFAMAKWLSPILNRLADSYLETQAVYRDQAKEQTRILGIHSDKLQKIFLQFQRIDKDVNEIKSLLDAMSSSDERSGN